VVLPDVAPAAESHHSDDEDHADEDGGDEVAIEETSYGDHSVKAPAAELQLPPAKTADLPAAAGGGDNSRQRFLEDQCALHTRSKASLRASLHLDLVGMMATASTAGTPEAENEDVGAVTTPSGRKLRPSQVWGAGQLIFEGGSGVIGLN